MRVRQRTHALRVIWAPSILRRMLRHRHVQALAVLAVVVVVVSSLAAKAAELDRQRTDWGHTERGLVVTERVEPGELVAAFVQERELPLALLPPGAVQTVPVQSRAKVALLPGEVLLGERITGAPGGIDDLILPTGAVGLTVPIVRLVPFLAEGDLVDLWSIDSANMSSTQVAANVVVLALADNELTIAVSHAHVAALTASSLRPLTVTLVG